jgi:hypothetical protein
MSSTSTNHETEAHSHDSHAGHGHHVETFFTKYIFSLDHKMIAKQFLNYWYVLGNYWWIIFCNIQSSTSMA